MGLIIDTSALIADERGNFEMAAFLRQCGQGEISVTAITASELLHGVERATDAIHKAKRGAHVEQTLTRLAVIAFDLAQARVHARIWADLMTRGKMIGAHDLLIAAAGIATGTPVGTLNFDEFARVTGLSVVDARPFLRL